MKDSKNEEFNIEKIVEVVTLKEAMSYKEFCEKTNTKYLTGRSKTLQLKRLEAYCIFAYDKSIKKYVFQRMKTDEEKLNDMIKGKFQDAVEGVLSHALAKQDGYCKTFTTNELLLATGMISEDHSVCRYDGYIAYYGMIEKMDNAEREKYISEDGLIMINQFQNTTKYMELSLSSYLKGALNSLDRKSIIKVRESFRVFIRHPEYGYFTSILDVPIGSELESTILRAMNNVLKKYGYSTIQAYRKAINDEMDETISNDHYNRSAIRKEFDAIKGNMTEDFNIEFKELTNGRYDGFYKCHHITYNNASLRGNVEYLKEKANMESMDKILELKSFKNTEQMYNGFMKIMIDANINKDRPYGLVEYRDEYRRKQKERM
ncbi:MAG: hypothetical protein ACRCTZ_20670 [Sarcina sp.]